VSLCLPKDTWQEEKKRSATHAPLIHLSSSIYFKKVDFKQKGVFDVTSETPFCLKLIFLSKRGGQREDEGRIFSISRKKKNVGPKPKKKKSKGPTSRSKVLSLYCLTCSKLQVSCSQQQAQKTKFLLGLLQQCSLFFSPCSAASSQIKGKLVSELSN
jgi:hypothetical protein